ncbi:MAG TPA: ribonuclease III [Clostridia bacterium]|nr:ribonuclease III [Clostridia bacterium]
MKSKNNQFKQLEKNLNFSFKNQKLLKQALIHRSFLNEVREKKLSSNERLEFLGDAILEFWVSDQLFRRFSEFPEGKMTFVRTHLVRTETLAKLGRNLQLGQFLLMSKGEELGDGRENPVLLANTFEALLGAIFLDQGLEKAAEFLKSQFEPLLSKISPETTFKDNKSLLQELVQAKGQPTPSYRLISSAGPDHQKIFTMGVYVGERFLAQGTDKSKQEAEEEAAQKALEILGKIE